LQASVALIQAWLALSLRNGQSPPFNIIFQLTFTDMQAKIISLYQIDAKQRIPAHLNGNKIKVDQIS
tara:strand:- start:861 stop:1061 length:201 start_codon:yes stop_codon:yes gene_type:complete